METSRRDVAPEFKPIILNLGCGYKKHPEAINVDGFTACKPDMLWDLNKFPYPWEDNSVDQIFAYHILEHLDDYWGVLNECARILKYKGTLEIRVPDISTDAALGYRDHIKAFNLYSFEGIANRIGGRKANSWAEEQKIVPLVLIRYAKVPYYHYNWIPFFILRFCAKHLRNFIWEQRLLFVKIHPDQVGQKFGHPRTEFLRKMTKWY